MTIEVWTDLDYFAVLYSASQIVLAGGDPVELWDHARWYVAKRRQPVTQIYDTLEQAWFDATGEQLTA